MSIRVGGKVGFGRSPIEKIFDQTLAAAGHFDITGIPPFGSYLRILASLRGDQATAFTGVHLFLNGDETLTNYRSGGHSAGTTHANAGPAESPIVLLATGSTATANYFGECEAIIHNYTDAHNKVFTTRIGIRDSATNIFRYSYLGHWENTAIVNRVIIKKNNDPTNELIAGSRVQMWIYR